MLRDPASASLLFGLSRAGGYIGFPEVIEREVLKHGAALGREARERVEKGLREIRALTGEAPAVTLPSDEAFHEAARARVRDLESLLRRVPFTTDAALAALDRVNANLPPARTSQQFKDCVIWSACLELARNYDVHLITADKAFFEGSNPQRGIDLQLRSECEQAGVGVTLHASLSDALKSVGRNAATSFDPRLLLDALELPVRELASEPAEQHGLVPGEVQTYDVQAYVTEKHDMLAVTFSFSFAGLAKAQESLIKPVVTVDGQAMYNAATGAVAGVKPDRVILMMTDDGTPIAQHVWAYVGDTISLGDGSPVVGHSFRVPLFRYPSPDAEGAADSPDLG